MKKLTKEQQKRLAIWIARCTTHFDSPEIRKEATEHFMKKNGLDK